MFDGFYHSGLLWLALGALAPIVIHLAARSRPKPTPFPAVQFILTSHRRHSAKFKLKQLLLLLLRCSLLGLFALVVARPWVEGAPGPVRRARLPVTAVLLLDTSYSMGVRVGETTALEKAKRTALAALDAFAPGRSRACLLFVNDSPQPVVTDFEHAYALEEIRKHVREAPQTARGTDCTAALAKALRMLRDVEGAGKAVFLFTDLTQRAWPRPLPAGDGKDGITVYVADVGPEKPANPAVLGLTLPNHIAAGETFDVGARVDTGGAGGRSIELAVDGEKRDQAPAGGRGIERVSLLASAPGGSGDHWGRVSIKGPDPLPLDNVRWFTFRSTPARTVLLVNGAPSPVRRKDELYFLRIALAPSRADTGQAFRLREVRAAELDAADLGDVDVLALCNVRRVSPRAWAAIRRHLAAGRGLAVFGGDRVDPAAYAGAAKGQAAVLPCTLGPPVAPAPPAHLEPGRLAHPILREFREGRNGDLAAPKFRKYLKLTPNANKTAETVLAFKNGDPALVAGRYLAGRVLVFASSCDADWNDLPREIPNPVLMQEAFRFLAGFRRPRRDVLVGTSPALRIAHTETVARVTLTRLPEGKPRDITAQLDRKSGSLAVPACGEPGVYRVEVARVRGDTEKKLFAVNLDTQESDLTRLAGGETELRSLLPGRRVVLARTTQELLDHISRTETASEVSSHLAGIVLALLLGEMFLSNHMRSRVQTADPEESPGTSGQ